MLTCLQGLCREYVWIWLNMPQQCQNMAQYALMSLNIAGCPWICLKMPKWIVLIMPGFSICFIILGIWQWFEYTSDIKYAKLLNMPWCTYNNFIIATIVTIHAITIVIISNIRMKLAKIKQKLSNSLSLNFGQKCPKNKCVCFKEIIWLILMKMGIGKALIN